MTDNLLRARDEKLTMTISLTEREQEALERLMAEQELSSPQVFKCALREYQTGHERRKAGETIRWSGDAQRQRDFAGPLLDEAQPPECAASPLPSGKHQLDTSMESGPNNCFFCDQPMGGR